MEEKVNRVLKEEASVSTNFYQSDLILQSYLKTHLPAEALDYMDDKLDRLGRKAATEMDDLSQKADKQGPVLEQRDRYGNEINRIKFHPAYWDLVDIAAESEMFYVKYDEILKEKFKGRRNAMGFAAGQLYAMSELGVYCPLCMTDGAAHLVDRYASDDVRARLLPRLSAHERNKLYTGAMFLTEKSGGSDVGRNLASAEQEEGKRYHLNGEKWFCSNVNAQVIMALARTGKLDAGTRGLSLFMVEKELKDGRPNPMHIKRLKDKIGVRSMATGEVVFDDTVGFRLGEENKGFKLMAEMINISRTYNAVAAIGGMRRALIEAWQYLNFRITFGSEAVEHALIRQNFHELGARYVSDFLLVWRAIRAMDAAEQGDSREQHLMRILVPMAKWKSAEDSVYLVRECMELMGGNGYIEDFIMAKLFRDVNVLPIWEGSGNIIVLDMLRAARKSEGFDLVIDSIRETTQGSGTYRELLKERLDALLKVWDELAGTKETETVEATAKPLFKELIHLYQMALIIKETNTGNEDWMKPSLDYLASTFNDELKMEKPLGLEEIRKLIGWKW